MKEGGIESEGLLKRSWSEDHVCTVGKGEVRIMMLSSDKIVVIESRNLLVQRRGTRRRIRMNMTSGIRQSSLCGRLPFFPRAFDTFGVISSEDFSWVLYISLFIFPRRP